MFEHYILVRYPYILDKKPYDKVKGEKFMYSYQDRNFNYYNNMNFNQPYYAEDANPSSLYDPYQGFIRGNMFPNLYNWYKFEQPMDLTAMSEKDQLLIYLDALSFATIDINLYLDNYPNDKDMIALFNQYRMEADQVRSEYESKYGPILVDSDASNTYPWAWDNRPWPWENQ